MNSSPLGGILFVLAATSLTLYLFLDAIIFFGCIIAFNALYLYRIHKMEVSEEERRLGKKGRAITAFLGVLAVQAILWSYSFTLPTENINMQRVESVRYLTSGFGMSLFLCGVAGIALSFGIAKTIKEGCPKNPPVMLRYSLGLAMALSSSLILVGFISSFGVLIFSLSRQTSVVFEVRKAFFPLLAAVTAMHFLMARLRFQNGEVATVYLFGSPIYMVTEHSDLIVPPMSATLQLLTDLLDQHPIGFSLDFGTMREELVKKERKAFVIEQAGVHSPTRLDGGGGNSPGSGGSPPLPKPSQPSAEVMRRVPQPEPERDTGGVLKASVPVVTRSSPQQPTLVVHVVKRGDELIPKPAELQRSEEVAKPATQSREEFFRIDAEKDPSLADVGKYLASLKKL